MTFRIVNIAVLKMNKARKVRRDEIAKIIRSRKRTHISHQEIIRIYMVVRIGMSLKGNDWG